MRMTLALMLALIASSTSSGQTYAIQTVAGGALPENTPALSASLGDVYGVAVEEPGSIVFGSAIEDNNVIYAAIREYNIIVRRDGTGTLTRVAGNGKHGYSGDNGPATSAQLGHPEGIAVDSSGNLYIADYLNHRIRKVSNGVITTVAGNGTRGYSGDNGLATSAQLNYPSGVAVDFAGNLYIADSSNHRIRKVSNGVITTVAGNGTSGYSGDNGPATSAQLRSPRDVVADSAGNIYIADTQNYRIRKVSNGVIITVAGNGTFGYSGDNGPAASAQLSLPFGISVDSAGNLYIGDYNNFRIRKVSNGVITTVAGNGTEGYSGDNGPAASARLYYPRGVAVDSVGNLYIGDSWNHRIRKVSNGVITTAAGNGSPYSGDNGPPTKAQLSNPRGIVIDPIGNLYFADTDNHRIRKVSNGVITTVAGNGTYGYSGDNGPAASAQLNAPRGVAVDSLGNLYIGDSMNHRIRKVSNGVITTVAGNGTSGYSGDNGPATDAQLSFPLCVAVDSAGNLYIADYNNSRIRKVSNGVITTIAQLSMPENIAVDSSGNLYIADYFSSRIRKVSNGVITTVVGTGASGYSGDNGPAISAQLSSPRGVSVDSAGDLYIADSSNYRIRKVSNGVITTIAGNGTRGYSGDGGPAVNAQLGLAEGVALDSLNNVYFTDTSNQTIRVLTGGEPPCTYSVSTKDLGLASAGGQAKLSIHTDSSCTWSVSNLPYWLSVSGISQGTGPAEITLVASTNSGGMRTASVSIGDVSAPVRQLDSASCGGSPTCTMRSLPHLAFGGEWTTALSAINSETAAGSFSVGFYDNSGASVALPFTAGLGAVSTLSDTVPAQGLKYYEAENPSMPVQAAWGLVTTDASVTVQAIFRRHTAGGNFYEAAVPASEGYSAFIVPFDATTFAPTSASMYTGFAVANLNPSATAHVVCAARDHLGQVLPNAVTIPALNPSGHYSDFWYPALAGKRGTLECTADTLVSAIALRAIGADAFSTLPVIVK